MQYTQTTEDPICKEVNNNNKVLIMRKWMFFHNWAKVGDEKLRLLQSLNTYIKKKMQ